MTDEAIRRVLEFWFSASQLDAPQIDSRMERWFSSDPELDRRIRDEFGCGTRPGGATETFRLSYPAVSLDPSKVRVTVREREAEPRRDVAWAFVDPDFTRRAEPLDVLAAAKRLEAENPARLNAARRKPSPRARRRRPPARADARARSPD